MAKRFFSSRRDVDATGPRPQRYADERYAKQRARGLRWPAFSADLEREYQASAQGRRTTQLQILSEVALVVLAGLLIAGTHRLLEGGAIGLAIALGLVGFYLIEREGRHNFLMLGELRQQAQVDSLTDVLNRRAFHEHLERIWRQATRDGVAVGLALIDIDHFKQLNDRLGHPVGDRVLQRVASVLKSYTSRPLDVVGRYGGDEFIIAWYDADPVSFAALVQLLPAKIWLGLAAVHTGCSNLTASGGAVLVSPRAEPSIEDAIQRADEELYRVKQTSRGAIALAPAHAVARDAATPDSRQAGSAG